jgi:WD40 repeat protein
VQTLEGTRLGHESTVWAVAFSPDGAHMASVSDDRTLKVWDCGVKDGEPLFRLAATASGSHSRAVFSVSWAAGGLIATGCGAFSTCMMALHALRPLLRGPSVQGTMHA